MAETEIKQIFENVSGSFMTDIDFNSLIKKYVTGEGVVKNAKIFNDNLPEFSKKLTVRQFRELKNKIDHPEGPEPNVEGDDYSSNTKWEGRPTRPSPYGADSSRILNNRTVPPPPRIEHPDIRAAAGGVGGRRRRRRRSTKKRTRRGRSVKRKTSKRRRRSSRKPKRK